MMNNSNTKNVYALILAGGKGTRMGNVEKPNQFLNLGGKPIIAHTIEKFSILPDFEKVIVLTPSAWIRYTNDIVKKFVFNKDKVVVIEGGSSRNETIMNGIDYIANTFGMDSETIIVTHDSVRPFVTHRIITENIQYAKTFGSCDTVISATDTIVCSDDANIISNIPDRAKMYQGQTPQTFHAQKLKELYYSLSEAEKEILTDACKIMVIKGEPVKLVEGEPYNIKITVPFDLKVANALIGDGGKKEC